MPPSSRVSLSATSGTTSVLSVAHPVAHAAEWRHDFRRGGAIGLALAGTMPIEMCDATPPANSREMRLFSALGTDRVADNLVAVARPSADDEARIAARETAAICSAPDPAGASATRRSPGGSHESCSFITARHTRSRRDAARAREPRSAINPEFRRVVMRCL